MSTLPNRSPGRLATYQDARKAVAAGKDARLRFGNGLYMIVTKAGTASWRCNWLKGGKNQVETLGRFPEMSVNDAKDARLQVRKAVGEGGDPSLDRKTQRADRKASNAATVEVVARQWIATEVALGHWVPEYKAAVEGRFRNFINPAIGNLPVGQVTYKIASELLLDVLEKARSQAVCVRQNLSSLIEFAMVHDDKIAFNPIQRGKKYLPKRGKGDSKAHPHAKKIDRAREILRAIEVSDVTKPQNRPSAAALLAHRLIALTSVRKREATEAHWSEVDFDAGLWTIPAERMKGRKGEKEAFTIPLSPQALDVFRVARQLAAKGSVYVFPVTARRDRPLDDSTINELMKRRLALAGLPGALVPHGWRATMSTVMNERNYLEKTLVDVNLGHSVMVAAEGHYNHAQWLKDRRRIATDWADMLMVGAPTASALVGLDDLDNCVVQWAEAA